MSENTPEKTALIVFAKRPQLGQGKQRLAAEVGIKTAYAVAQHLLNITSILMQSWNASLVISPSETQDSAWANELVERANISIPQRSGSLGERLEQIDREVRMLGYTRLIFIGSDAPLLSAQHLKQVESALLQYKQVFIPATDGGVVLMASSVRWRKLTQVDWSTEKVFTQLKSLAIQQGLSVKLYQQQSDLDDLASYKSLRPLITQRLALDSQPDLEQIMDLLDKEINHV